MNFLQKFSAIKAKVVVGFALAIGTMVLAGFISYNSYKELLSSVGVLSEPNQKLKYSNNILTDLNKAETAVRSFILTRNPSSIEEYIDLVGGVKANIDSFMTHTNYTELQMQKIDSVSSLLDEKMDNLNSFIRISGNSGSINFTARALEAINKRAQDSSRATVASTVTTTTSTNLDTLYDRASADEQKAKGLVRKIKKLFSGKKAKEKYAKDSLAVQETLTRVRQDTSVVIQPDTIIINNVKSILAEIRTEEQRGQFLQKNAEAKWLEQNSLIVSQIKTIVSDLEEEEMTLSLEKKNEARQLVNQSMITLGLIILICFISCLIFISLIFGDIAKGNFYRKRLEKAKKHAEKLASIKERFLATMSHEIRTPLNSIIGFSNKLSETHLKDDQENYLNIIQKSSDHLLTTVNDVLDFSKIEAGKLSINEVSFGIEEAINDVYNTMLIRAREKNLSLTKEYVGKSGEIVLGDPHRLKQILFNLVGNAIKFTEQGEVSIRCSVLEKGKNYKAKIEISDTGIGIPKDKIKSAFEDFNQVDGSSKRKYGGTGLGLSISKRLVDLQNGSLVLKSEEGKGTTFAIEIPYKKGESKELVGKSIRAAIGENSLAGKRALLVDDDEFGILLTESALKILGIEVQKAKNGKLALEELEQGSFDLIITDIQMPEFSGIDLAKEVRKNENLANLPILALTANVMKDDLNGYIKAGMNDYLIKPFKNEELIEKLNKLFLKEIKAGTSERNGQIVSKNNGTVHYSLDDFRKFSTGDDEMMQLLINSFLENAVLDLERLNDAQERNDKNEIASVAHKMLTPFGHIQATDIVPLLKKLERINHNDEIDQDVISNCVEEINQEAQKLFEAIKNKAYAAQKTT